MIIYKITNTVDGKVYIGMTTTELDVRKPHINLKRKSLSKPLYQAMREFGWTSFQWEIIDQADNMDELSEKERY